MTALPHGKVIGRYRIERLLGQGGMGQVYQAYDVVLRRSVALKVVTSRSLSVDEIDVRRAASRVLREARAAAALSHPNAVAIFDVDQVDEIPFIAMELVLGTTLRAHVTRPDVSFGLRLRWLVEIARVLDAAHRAGLVHRDIKPENIMVSREGVVKVLDFGIAQLTTTEGPVSLPPDSRATAEGPGSHGTLELVAGTPRYMAPEHREGAPADGRSDQYSWGVVAFELLAGSHPWKLAKPEGPRLPLVSLADAAPDVPKPIARVIDRALAATPSDRYPSMAVVALSLEAFLVPDATSSGADVAALARAKSELKAENQTVVDTTRFTTPLGTQEGKPTPGQRWRKVAAGLLALTALTAVGATRAWRARHPSFSGRGSAQASASSATDRPPPHATGSPIVLIPLIDNQTGDPAFDGTIELIVESSLKRSTLVYPYAGARARAAVAEVDPTGKKHADDQLGPVLAAHTGRPVATVFGTAEVVGSSYTLSLRAALAGSNAVLASSSVRLETTAQVFPEVTRFASAIRAALGDAPSNDDLEKSGMSPLLDADHEFALSVQAVTSGKEALGISHIKRALELDPGFAMAQGSFGVLLLNASRESEAAPHLLAAVESGALADREKLLFAAAYYHCQDDPVREVRAYEELVARWPAETRYVGNLAAGCIAAGDFARARTLARQAVEQHPSSLVYRSNLVAGDVLTEDFAAARADVQVALAAAPRAGAETYVYGAVAAMLEGERDEAQDRVTRLRTGDPSAAAVLEADLLAFEGKLDAASHVLDAAIQKDEEQHELEEAMAKWAVLAEVRGRAGKPALAREAARHAATSSRAETAYRAARALIDADDLHEATPILVSLAHKPGARARLFTHLLEAARHRREGAASSREAARDLSELVQARDNWLARVALGETYLSLGQFVEAERELAIAMSRRGEGANALLGQSTSTLRYIPPLAYALARAKEGRHDAGAADAYRAFLAMDSSDEDPLVRAAKKGVIGP